MNTYNEIEKLNIIQAMRLRSGMYLGTTEEPHHLFNEVFDNALDEALSGNCSEISITLSDDNETLSVHDNGRGFPNHFNSEGVHDVITSCTEAHSSGKFNHEAYKRSIGLHGIGITAVNAVSDKFSIYTVRDKVATIAEFSRGELQNFSQIEDKSSVGTTVTVHADHSIYKSIKFDKTKIQSRLELAVTFCDVKITFNGLEVNKLDDKDFAPNINTRLMNIDVTIPREFSEIVKGETVLRKVNERAFIKFGYNMSGTRSDTSRGSVNLLRVDSGAHIRCFEKAIVEAWQSLVDEDTKNYLNSGDYLIGLSGFILVELTNPQYNSQTKDALSGTATDYRYIVKALVPSIIKELKSDKKLMEALIRKFKDYRSNLNKLSTSNYLDEMIKLGDSGSTTSRKLSIGSKLIDCTSKKREGTELYLAEGRSAAGGLIPYRNPKLHAILPLRGKVKNIIDLDIKDIVSNAEIRTLINAMGTGCFHKEDPDRCRYEKIIIETDADSDGYQIQALLLGVFLYCTPLTLKSGRIYIMETPLFGQYVDNKFVPRWDESEINRKDHFLRFKGLGSFDANELASVSFDQDNRHLRQVTIDDANKAMKLIRSSSSKRQVMIDNGVLI